MGRYLQRNDRPAQTQNVTGAGGRDRRWIGVARQVGSTRGGGVSGLLALICFVAGQNIATIVFAALALIFLVYCITKTSRS